MADILKAILFGIVEGITEWLPVSSTGHMILLNEFVKMNVSESFWSLFLVVIQLGAIMAVVLLFWDHILPSGMLRKNERGRRTREKWLHLWCMILVACVPAAVVGVLFDDVLDKLFYHWYVVAASLIVFGVAFIVTERINTDRRTRVKSLYKLRLTDAAMIGVFQLIAAVFPGTSRSGATIIGALLIGISRTVAAEFTFLLAIPVMFGASLLKIIKFGLVFTMHEAALLLCGMAVAFLVSLFAIRFLLAYIRAHSFRAFGIYRIVLGVLVIVYFALVQ